MMTGDIGRQLKQNKCDGGGTENHNHIDVPSEDVVDFVPIKSSYTNHFARPNGIKATDSNNSIYKNSNEGVYKMTQSHESHDKNDDSLLTSYRSQNSHLQRQQLSNRSSSPGNTDKLSFQTQQINQNQLDKKPPLFPFQRKKSDPSNLNTISAKDRPKFVKCASIARLFGNTYSTQQSQAQHLQQKDESTKIDGGKTAVGNNRSTLKCERFKKCPENQIDDISTTNTDVCNKKNGDVNVSENKLINKSSVQYKDFCDDKDLSVRAFRTISKSLGKLWRRSHSVDISAPDPEYKVLYLGNVLTGWAKGDSCIEKPLATLWRNYTQNNKPDVVMRILVCSSGLKATTRQHGLTEYWSNRITHCSSPKNYPRIFCWIYRHEGRKLKHELRCHAVLCPKESIAEQICQTLKDNLARALQEFKRDKINRQNARLSLVNSVYENPSMPRRKILLSVGANNYRPPMERSKSAPKLMAIEEAVGEEDEEPSQTEENKPSCCKIDPLFPAMTLGRKHCRRGHSIRRNRVGMTAGSSATLQNRHIRAIVNETARIRSVSFEDDRLNKKRTDEKFTESGKLVRKDTKKCINNNELDDDDDFNSLLLVNDYDTQSSLSGELMSYFDNKLKPALSMSELRHHDSNEVSMDSNLKRLSHRAAVSLDDLDTFEDDDYEDNNYCIDDYDNICNLRQNENTFYNQNEIIDCLANVSNAEADNLNDIVISSPNCNDFDESRYFEENAISHTGDEMTLKHMLNEKLSLMNNGNKRPSIAMMMDSDEGSISSGCETSSTVTTTHYDEIMKMEKEQQQAQNQLRALASLNGTNCTTIITLVDNETTNQTQNPATSILKSSLKTVPNNNNDEDCNSEYSDESGFDEFQNFASTKQNSFNKHSNLKQISIESTDNNCSSTSIKDNSKCITKESIMKNSNNSNCEFAPSNKNSTRLMINIPKNAKSILI